MCAIMHVKKQQKRRVLLDSLFCIFFTRTIAYLSQFVSTGHVFAMNSFILDQKYEIQKYCPKIEPSRPGILSKKAFQIKNIFTIKIIRYIIR